MQTLAVCDRYFNDDGEMEDGVRYYRTYTDLLQEDLDILSGCMPNDIAPDVTIAGLQQVCTSSARNRPRYERYRPGRRDRIGPCRPETEIRFQSPLSRPVREALRIVRDGELGKVVNLKGVYGKSQLITFGQTSLRTDRGLAGGGVLLDQGIHMVDLLRLFGGEFEQVHSIVSNDFWKHDVEDNAYALMRTEAGVVAMLDSSATQWRHRFNLDITLEKGSLILSGILSGSKSYGAEMLTIARASRDDVGDPLEQTTGQR